jgi:uncharacterized protein YcnI
MRKTVLVVGSMASAMLLTLTVSAPAWAHVVVSPEEVAAEDYATLTVSVPTEKEVPTTKVRVEVPDGFVLSGVQPVPGWDSSFEEDGGLITAVTFSGGEIRPREFQQFLVQAQAPKEPGEYPWKAFQTYQDGSVVKWTGPPDAEEPASVVTVVSVGSGGHGSGSGGTSPLVYAGLGGVGVLALAALAALLVRRLIDI